MRVTTFGLACWLSAGLLLAVDPVKTESGLVSGVAEGELLVFRGIPYAAPPVGELRWRSPQPAAPWQGVRAADKFGPVCMQAARPGGSRAMSEDCLTLNIRTPVVQSGERLPVMVWIHGGAFRSGAGSMPVYDGASLPRQGVVLVTINYRLGDFGRFGHPALAKMQRNEPLGNYHLMDQIAALRWVQKNIAAFGGDPKRATIFGESAGGSSVLFLMTSPEARGLFQRAIVESGGGSQTPQMLSQLEAAGERIAAELGVDNEADPVKAMRAIPAADLMKRLEASRQKAGGRAQLGAYQPVIDGKVVTGGPAALFEAGKQAPVPLIIGANSYEATLMNGFGVTTAAVLAMAGGQLDEARRVYQSETKGDTDLLAARLFGDSLFVFPAHALAVSMASVKQPAWLYYYSYVPAARRGKMPGAGHAAEIPMVFGNLRAPALAATDADRKMSERMSSYWVRFAKTGNPNPTGTEEWPVYKRETDQLLEFGETIAVRTNFRKEQMEFQEKRWRAANR